ncbi:MAG: hypothetical protein NVS4B7_12440 [Ktedonobacteraceae bacterium]
MSLVLLLARLGLSAVFLVAGLAKLTDLAYQCISGPKDTTCHRTEVELARSLPFACAASLS